MIVGCYTLDLYCDGPDHYKDGLDFAKTDVYQFTAQNGSAARREARREGWLLDEKADRALCPRCAKTVSRTSPARVALALSR